MRFEDVGATVRTIVSFGQSERQDKTRVFSNFYEHVEVTEKIDFAKY